MNNIVAGEPVEVIKYQVYLGLRLQNALSRYISDHFGPEDRVVSAVLRKATREFLEREGYFNDPTTD